MPARDTPIKRARQRTIKLLSGDDNEPRPPADYYYNEPARAPGKKCDGAGPAGNAGQIMRRPGDRGGGGARACEGNGRLARPNEFCEGTG